MRTLIRNILFSVSAGTAVAALFVPIRCKLFGIHYAFSWDSVVNGATAQMTISQNSAYPPLPISLTNGASVPSILSHWRQILMNGATVSTFENTQNLYIPMGELNIEAGASLYVHTNCNSGTLEGMVLFYIAEY